MASSNISVEKQEELLREFITKYKNYLDEYELDEEYWSKKGKDFIEHGIDRMMDSQGMYIFDSTDSASGFRVDLWIEAESDNNFLPFTDKRWKLFVEQFEKRNNVKKSKLKIINKP